MKPNLTGVPETMLCALYNRAHEAARPDGIIADPDALRIFAALTYDFAASFGRPDGSHAVRARMFDDVLRAWLDLHPDGQVVALGDGLETQNHRLDNGRLRWFSIDLPEALAVRARFLPATDRFQHVPADVFGYEWLDHIDASRAIFFVASGLLMYFQPEQVRALFVRLGERFPGVEILFDTIPRWLSRRTLQGLQKTQSYRVQPMPWGIDRNELAPTLKAWGASDVRLVPLRHGRRWYLWFVRLVLMVPWLRHKTPAVVHAKLSL